MKLNQHELKKIINKEINALLEVEQVTDELPSGGTSTAPGAETVTGTGGSQIQRAEKIMQTIKNRIDPVIEQVIGLGDVARINFAARLLQKLNFTDEDFTKLQPRIKTALKQTT